MDYQKIIIMSGYSGTPLLKKLVAFEDTQAASFLLRISFSAVRATHFMHTTLLGPGGAKSFLFLLLCSRTPNAAGSEVATCQSRNRKRPGHRISCKHGFRHKLSQTGPERTGQISYPETAGITRSVASV